MDTMENHTAINQTAHKTHKTSDASHRCGVEKQMVGIDHNAGHSRGHEEATLPAWGPRNTPYLDPGGRYTGIYILYGLNV